MDAILILLIVVLVLAAAGGVTVSPLLWILAVAVLLVAVLRYAPRGRG